LVITGDTVEDILNGEAAKTSPITRVAMWTPPSPTNLIKRAQI
jgi:hypothetical protein